MNDEIFSIIGLGFFWGNVYGGFLAMLGEEIYERIVDGEVKWILMKLMKT